jgi:predicted ATP-dependent protease
MMQVRKGLFNILLFGGRLFQQWVVDMYIKIESMMLDWYSNPKNQKLIRVELYQVGKIKSLNITMNMDNSYISLIMLIYVLMCAIGIG